MQPYNLEPLQRRFRSLALLALLLLSNAMPATTAEMALSARARRTAFPLIAPGQTVGLVIGEDDAPGVSRALKQFAGDLEKVSGSKPLLYDDLAGASGYVIIAGTLGKNRLIDDLAARRKIRTGDIAGKWESTLMQVVKHPFPGIKKALVIAGSDRRGTIFGIYELSSQIGVSPWHWWADVPVRKQEALYFPEGRYICGSPKVKYRGIFINDEAPALSGWVHEKFGGFNHEFYGHVFELILRMKGNFLWPAMWGRAFYDDDPLNPWLAHECGIVIGTSHHEPMMRAHDEWRRFGTGKWNYRENDTVLREFWKTGMVRKGDYESLVTVGMRGDGDEPMSRSANIALLEQIIRDQREIIRETTGRETGETPQVWALYKEVQEYYDLGMRVPDDVTLLLCDDNWGNVRKLPKPGSTPRTGGYGMYYHFDYVGGPRNYKWLNTNPIPRVWEQMNLCYRNGVDRIWIVNVGDIKPMEFPIHFFLDMAWNPEVMTSDRVAGYSREWAGTVFGPQYAAEIGRMIDDYTRYNSRRKPELIDASTFSLHHYREAELITDAWNRLADDAAAMSDKLPAEFRDAFFQLVLFPIQACANLNDLYVTAGRNRLYASQGRAATNDLADRVEQLFLRDSLLTLRYNRELAGGKWNHMMDQTHIGYTWWQEPPRNRMPRTQRITPSGGAVMRVAPEGSAEFQEEGILEVEWPVLDTYHTRFFYADIFNAGTEPFDFTIVTGKPWLKTGTSHGTILKEERIFFTLDEAAVPPGKQTLSAEIIASTGKRVELKLQVFRPSGVPSSFSGFAESNGAIAIDAARYSAKTAKNGISWEEIPGLGRTLSGMSTFPVTAKADTLWRNNPSLEYDLWLFTPGEVTVRLDLSPTLDYYGTGLRYAVAMDDEEPRIIDIHGDYGNLVWEEWVRNNIIGSESKHTVNQTGRHTLKIFRVDPGVVIQKIIVDTGGLRKSYLGPPSYGAYHQ